MSSGLGRRPFERIKELALPTSTEEIGEEQRLLNTLQEKLQHLRDLRSRFKKAQEIDPLIADEIWEAQRLLDYVEEKILRLRRVQEGTDENVPEWTCPDSTCAGLFHALQRVPQDQPFILEVDEEGRPKWDGDLTELAFLCECLRDAGLIRGLGSKGDFRKFVMQEFTWKREFNVSSLEQTWTDSLDPNAQLDEVLTEEKKLKRYEALRDIAGRFAGSKNRK